MINPRLICIILISIGIFALLMPQFFIAAIWTVYPFKEQTKLDFKIQCITQTLKANPQIIDNIEKHPEIMNALINNDTSKLIVKEYVTVMVTPTLDYRHYFPTEYQNGTRMLLHPFSWYRANVNIGNNNLKTSVNVYDYKIFPSFYYQDLEYTNAIGQGYIQKFPIDRNNTFLFVFVSVYEDDLISKKTPNMWLPTEKNFMVQINNKIYPPIDYLKQIQIRELEHITNQNDDYIIQAFGQNVMYKPISPNSHEYYNNGTQAQQDYTSFGGMISNQHYFITKGMSNKEDGYILFEIPKNTPIEKIKVLGNFFAFGNAQWFLWNENSQYYKDNIEWT